MIDSKHRTTELYKNIVEVTENSTLAHKLCEMVLDGYKLGYLDGLSNCTPKKEYDILNWEACLED